MNNGVRYDRHRRIAIQRDTKFLSLFHSERFLRTKVYLLFLIKKKDEWKKKPKC